MSEDDIDEIEARWAAATPGPWSVESIGLGADVMAANGEAVALCGDPKARPQSVCDAEAIAAAPTDVARLIARVRGLKESKDGVWRLRNAETALWMDQVSAIKRKRDAARAIAAALLEDLKADRSLLPDHGCALCVPGGDLVSSGFVCRRHTIESWQRGDA